MCVMSALSVSGCRFWQAADSASGELLTVGLRGLLGHALAVHAPDACRACAGCMPHMRQPGAHGVAIQL